MNARRLSSVVTLGLLAPLLIHSNRGSGQTLVGFIEPVTPLGQYMSLEVTIGPTHTLFEMTGPDFSWFAFGFDPDLGMPPNISMQGYSIIVEGLDANRSATEYNMVGVGNPGPPQALQNLEILSTTHDAANNLSTVLIRRLNDTGDPLDPIFPRDRNPLPIIWSYGSFGDPTSPTPELSYHGSNGRGDMLITFEPVAIPEPSTVALVLAGGAILWIVRKRRPMSQTP
jgi:hypothetical protein